MYPNRDLTPLFATNPTASINYETTSGKQSGKSALGFDFSDGAFVVTGEYSNGNFVSTNETTLKISDQGKLALSLGIGGLLFSEFKGAALLYKLLSPVLRGAIALP